MSLTHLTATNLRRQCSERFFEFEIDQANQVDSELGTARDSGNPEMPLATFT
jgi:hypothetical protein